MDKSYETSHPSLSRHLYIPRYLLQLLIVLSIHSLNCLSFRTNTLTIRYSLFYLPRHCSSSHYSDKRDKLSVVKSTPWPVDPGLVTDELSSSDISYIEIKQTSAISDATKSYNSSVLTEELDNTQFGDLFSQCAPYIAMHRNSVVVIHIGSHIFENRILFDSIIDDIAILHLLGIYIVIVAGVRLQLDDKFRHSNITPIYSNGIRISDDVTMKFLKEVSGSARFEIESALAKGYRGLPGQSGINVVSGNFFWSAKPFGVREGIDYKLTGEVRKIEVDNIKKRLEFGDIVLLTSLGYSPSGEVFNVQSESLAADCAAKLGSAKIIYLTNGETLIDNRSGKILQSLRIPQAIKLLESFGVKYCINGGINANESFQESNANSDGIADGPGIKRAITQDNKKGDGYVIDQTELHTHSSLDDLFNIISRSVYALQGGVKRAHLITPVRGSLLKELFTRDGSGMLISRDVYEGIQQATSADIPSIENIIQPLVQQGVLVHRTRDQLEKDLPNTFLLTRDGTVLGLGMLKIYDDQAEICCLAVDPKYRRQGKGETILAYFERRLLLMKIKSVFVLSTHTMQWFEERGFVSSDPSLLPPSRSYNVARASKVYIKHLGSDRDVDAEELLWNV